MTTAPKCTFFFREETAFRIRFCPTNWKKLYLTLFAISQIAVFGDESIKDFEYSENLVQDFRRFQELFRPHLHKLTYFLRAMRK